VLTLTLVAFGGGVAILAAPFGFGAELLSGSGVASDPAAEIFYHTPLLTIFPIILLFAVLVVRTPRSPLMFASLPVLILYLYGFYSGKFNYARLIPPYLTLVQLYASTEILLLIKNSLHDTKHKVVWCSLSTAASVVLITLLFGEIRYLQSATPSTVPANSLPEVLTKLSPGSDVIANFPASIVLPAYGFKVVVVKGYKPYFQPLYDENLARVEELFATTTSVERSVILLNQLEPAHYLLLSKNDPHEQELARALSIIAAPIVQSNNWEVFSMSIPPNYSTIQTISPTN